MLPTECFDFCVINAELLFILQYQFMSFLKILYINIIFSYILNNILWKTSPNHFDDSLRFCRKTCIVIIHCCRVIYHLNPFCPNISSSTYKCTSLFLTRCATWKKDNIKNRITYRWINAPENSITSILVVNTKRVCCLTFDIFADVEYQTSTIHKNTLNTPFDVRSMVPV